MTRSILLLLGGLSFLSCRSAEDDTPTAAPASDSKANTEVTTPEGSAVPPAALGGLTLSTGALVPAFDASVTDYSASSLTTLFPVDVTATAPDGVTLAVNGHAAASGIPTSLSLQPRQDVVLDVTSPSGESRRYTIHALPPTLPAFTVATLDPLRAGPENVLLTPDEQWLMVTSREGDPLYYKSLAPLHVTDFKEARAGGDVAYSFAADDGKVHLLDGHFGELSAVALLAYGAHADLPIDPHDFLLLGEDHYVVMAAVQEVVDLTAFNPAWAADAPVLAAVVQEIDHGSVLFEWDSSKVPSLFSDSVDGNAFTATPYSDYVHMNSIQVDPLDGNFIISLRHTDSILKLDRASGATIWTLGGRSDDFHLTVEQRPSHQHHARRLSDGTLLVFDNGNNAHPTRAISFDLDEAARSVRSFTTIYERPDGQADTAFMGSVFRMAPSRYVIGWGGRTDTSSAGPAVTEIVDGAPVWSLTFTSPTVFSYRATPAGN
jgi:hypothetical protein